MSKKTSRVKQSVKDSTTIITNPNFDILWENCIKLFKYRNIEMQSDPMPAGEMREALYSTSYVILSGKYGKLANREGNCGLYLFSQDSKYFDNLANFTKILQLALKTYSNIIIIAPVAPTSHFAKKLAALKTIAKNAYIEYYTYNIVCFEIPTHTLVPKHTIVRREDVDKLEELYKVDLSKVGAIHVQDPIAVWIGALAGDVVKVERFSEVSGKEIGYRIVR